MGHSSSKPYTTRSATGSIRVKHFKKSGSFSESETEVSEEEKDSTKSSLHHSSSNESSSSSSKSSSSSDSETESHSDTEHVPQRQQTVKKSVKPRLKAGLNVTNGSDNTLGKRTRSVRKDSATSSSSRRTRFQGKSTVQYKEESDNEMMYEDNTATNENYDGTTEEESDAESPQSTNQRSPPLAMQTTSSRGRVRKLTARAKAFLRD